MKRADNVQQMVQQGEGVAEKGEGSSNPKGAAAKRKSPPVRNAGDRRISQRLNTPKNQQGKHNLKH